MPCLGVKILIFSDLETFKTVRPMPDASRRSPTTPRSGVGDGCGSGVSVGAGISVGSGGSVGMGISVGSDGFVGMGVRVGLDVACGCAGSVLLGAAGVSDFMESS